MPATRLPEFDLQLIRFATKDMDLRYAFVIMDKARVRDLPVRIKRKNFDIEKEGIVIGCGAGQPDEDEILQMQVVYALALERFYAASAAA